LLQSHGITRLVDVRTVPRSRRNPQFNRDALPKSLQAVGIGYEHMEGLGGLRPALPHSSNTGWENSAFRGYADYMQTAEFEASLDSLIDLAGQEHVAIMCAEAVYWRCHRSLIADALTVRGIQVEHIMSGARTQRHRLTAFAKVIGTKVTYPSAGQDLT
jgi:uncharacterized protein (DUF488 family)